MRVKWMLFYRSSNCGLFKWERDGMLKVKSLLLRSLKKNSLPLLWKKQTLCCSWRFFPSRRRPDQRSAESSSWLEERSTASSSTASDGAKADCRGCVSVFLNLYESCFESVCFVDYGYFECDVMILGVLIKVIFCNISRQTLVFHSADRTT